MERSTGLNFPLTSGSLFSHHQSLTQNVANLVTLPKIPLKESFVSTAVCCCYSSSSLFDIVLSEEEGWQEAMATEKERQDAKTKKATQAQELYTSTVFVKLIGGNGG